MKRNLIVTSIAMALASGAVVSCGGGGGGDTGGATGVTTVGTITGFGSIFVNGVEYETNGTSYVVDDVSGNSQSALKVGMVVKIKGESNGTTGTAYSVYYDDDVEGPVLGITASGNPTRSFTVLGQTVIVDALKTAFEDEDGGAYDIDTMADGDVVEVSGYYDANGDLLASYVEKQSAGDSEFEAEGTVSGFTGTEFTLTLENNITLTVDISGISIDGTIGDGSYVEVEGSWDAGTSTLTASKVELEDKDGLDDSDDDVDIEGIVVYDAATDSYSINGIALDFSGNVEFEPESLADQVAGGGLAGTMLEVEGYMMGDVLIVEEAESEDGEIEMEAHASAFDFDAGSTTSGTLTLSFVTATGTTDVALTVNGQTLLNGFTLSELDSAIDMETVFLDVEAHDMGTGLIAYSLKRKSSTDEYQLEGPVSAFTDNTGSIDVTVAGVTYQVVDGTTTFDGSTYASFLSGLNVGTSVELRDGNSSLAADGIADVAKISD